MYWRLDSRARGNMCPLGTCAGVPLQGNSPEDSQKQTPSELRRRNAFPIPRVANLLGASERAPRPEDGDHEEADTLDHSSLLHGADFRGAEPPPVRLPQAYTTDPPLGEILGPHQLIRVVGFMRTIKPTTPICTIPAFIRLLSYLGRTISSESS
jgi:hypothetical protein